MNLSRSVVVSAGVPPVRPEVMAVCASLSRSSASPGTCAAARRASGVSSIHSPAFCGRDETFSGVLLAKWVSDLVGPFSVADKAGIASGRHGFC